MAKGQVRSNREAKKPKQDKPKREASYLTGGKSQKLVAPVTKTSAKK